uniref:Insulin-like androgenic gland factor n=1 Tax=Macrobrachium lar TaxID=224134 RepID=E9RGM0_MACLR|nr:insulin-like androgenic gland factor [Macrobrachium lar]
MGYWNTAVKSLFLWSLVALLHLPQPSSSYEIECLTVEFDCSNITYTLSRVCLRHNNYIDPGPSYISRGRRSVDNYTQGPNYTVPSTKSPSLVHPRATHLTMADVKPLKESKVEEEEEARMQHLTLSREEASKMLQSKRRLRRDNVRKTPREECCNNDSFRRCTFEEVAEYCIELNPGINTCGSSR